MRILGACRISKNTDASTSIERQREAITLTTRARGDSLVAITEDADTSGAVDPFGRIELGPWLTEPGKISQWDGLMVHKLDRLTRSTSHLDTLVQWCREHGKTLISVSESIDIATANGKMFVKFLGIFAEFERERISERRADHARKARQQARWDGRSIPTGYRPVKVDSHYELEPDPEAAPLVRRMADMVIAGTSARQVALALSAEGVPTIRGGQRWTTRNILNILRNPSLRGYVMHDGQPVLGEDGMPVQRTPILDDGTWAAVQAQLDRNGKPGSGVRTGSSLLLGILHCAECGQRLYIRRRKEGERYRHRDGSACTASYTARRIDQTTEQTILTFTDELPMMRRIEIPARDNSADLRKITESLAQLDAAFGNGQVTAETYGRMTAKLEERRDALAAQPATGPGERWEQTGELFSDYYQTLDTEARRQLLLSLSVRVNVCKPGSPALTPRPRDPRDWHEAERTVLRGNAVIQVQAGKINDLRDLAAAASNR